LAEGAVAHDRPDVELDLAEHVDIASRPVDGLRTRVELEDREAADELFRLGERAVDERLLAAKIA